VAAAPLAPSRPGEVGALLPSADGAAVLLLPAGTPPEAIELRVRGNVFLACAGTRVPGDKLLNVNQLPDGDFAIGVGRLRPTEQTEGWHVGMDHENWHLEGRHTAFICQHVPSVAGAMEVAYVSGQADGMFPLRPGATYQFSGLFALHRCTGAVVVRIVAADGRVLHEAVGRPSADAKGGLRADQYAVVTVNVQAPAEACAAQLLLRKGATRSGDSSWMFFSDLWFGRVNDSARRGWRAEPYTESQLAVMQVLDAGGIEEWHVPLPEARFEDAAAELEVIERATGRPLHGSPMRLGAPVELSGGIDGLDGTVVVGWASDLGRPGAKLEVRLLVDGTAYQTAPADQPHGDRQDGFRLALPAGVLDGLAHRITVRVASDGAVVGETAEMLPSLLTPWSAIARYGGVRLPARLSAAASYRYESLRAHVQARAKSAVPGGSEDEAWQSVLFAQISAAHERVVIGLDRAPKLIPLCFPVIAAPKVSIVIPVHNKVAVTHNCLAALILAYNRTSFEVIVVDDGSTDATRDIGKLVSGITVCRHEVAEGFVAACNLGAARARGEYIVLLNNDTEPTSRWLDEMLFAFDSFDDVGLVGSKLLYPDGRLQEAGGIVWGDGQPWNYGRLANAADPRYSYTRQADYLSGAAIMLPRRLWQELAGLSEEFRPAYYEDTDLCFKVRRAGYRTVYAANSVVFHFEGISSGTSTASGMKRFQEVNRPKFLHKWRGDYRSHGTDTSRVDLEKDRGVTLRALFIDAETPRPDNDAGSYAAIQEMRAMQAVGAKITFLPENLAYLGAYTHDLQRAGVEVIYAPFACSVEDFLAQRGREFDIVYITRYVVADRHVDTVRRYAGQAKIMFCNADLHFLRELREAIAAGEPEKLAAALTTRDTELRVMREVDITLSYNEVEHAVIMSHNLRSSTVALCPWIVTVPEAVPDFGTRSDIAFLGGFGHPPNADAVAFFVRDVMPLLRKAGLGARFHVYGSNVPPNVDAFARDDVIIHGFVEEVSSVYETCRVFVAPLQSGAGIKGKVVDALSFGVPSVLSPLAAEGIGLGEGTEAFIARTPAEWCDAIKALYTDEKLWREMSFRAQALARRRFSFERGVDQMRAAVAAAGLYPGAGMPLRNVSAKL
jgi:GT2 family glycosyltransferase